MKALYSVAGRVPWARVGREYRAALLPLVVILAINIGVSLLLVLPLSRRVAANEQRAVTAERQRALAQAEFKRAESLRDGKAQATSDLTTFYEKVLPANVAAARRMIQLRVQQQARQHDVEYQSGGSTEVTMPKSSLLQLTIQMRLAGSYDNIRAFIYALETSPDFVVIDNVKLAEGVDSNAPLEVALEVSTYYRAAPSGVVQTGGDGRR